jgi:hypothetical protein
MPALPELTMPNLCIGLALLTVLATGAIGAFNIMIDKDIWGPVVMLMCFTVVLLPIAWIVGLIYALSLARREPPFLASLLVPVILLFFAGLSAIQGW